MKVLVFGGKRFGGAHVAAALSSAGLDTTIMDVLAPRTDARGRVVESWVPSDADEVVYVDPAVSWLGVDPGQFDAVVFFGVDAHSEDARRPITGEDRATERRVFAALLAANPRAVVLASSSRVYSATNSNMLDESAPADAQGPVASHFRSMEQALEKSAGEHGFPAVVLRCGIVAGRDDAASHKWRARKMRYVLPGIEVARIDYPRVELRVGAPHVASDAPAVVDLVHISDVARAFLMATLRVRDLDSGVRVYNVGGGRALSGSLVRSLVDSVPDLTIQMSPKALRAPADAVLDTSAIREELGWRPEADDATIVIAELASYYRAALQNANIGADIRLAHEYLGSTVSDSYLTLYGVLGVLDGTGSFSCDNARFEVGGNLYKARFVGPPTSFLPLRRMILRPYSLRIPMEDVGDFPIQNVVRLFYVAPDGGWFRRRLKYSFLRGWARNHHGRLNHLTDTDSTLYIRQAMNNLFYVTLRARLVTDGFALAPRIALARVASFLYRRKTILLYEKQSMKYEESASVVYEAMMDRGMRRVRYVLDAERISDVPEKYRSRVVPRFSFSHFYHFFCAETLVGTEAPAHCAELRTANRALLGRLNSGRYSFVFLQHGVTYMVALSSRARSPFRAGNSIFPPRSKIAVCSELEAEHFIDGGGFTRENLYVCGIPKFDRAVRRPDAGLILIMPTWRPWEYNFIRANPTETPYYKMLVELLESVPAHLRDKALLMPHPLMAAALADSDLRDRIWTGSYDEALQSCAILVTDYSSIAYDAFYRGANVVFWWKEKDFCMQQYGGTLMLDEDNAFASVCYGAPAFARAVESAYLAPQDPEFMRRFRQIVEFNDNRNTERLLDFMDADDLI